MLLENESSLYKLIQINQEGCYWRQKSHSRTLDFKCLFMTRKKCHKAKNKLYKNLCVQYVLEQKFKILFHVNISLYCNYLNYTILVKYRKIDYFAHDMHVKSLFDHFCYMVGKSLALREIRESYEGKIPHHNILLIVYFFSTEENKESTEM